MISTNAPTIARRATACAGGGSGIWSLPVFDSGKRNIVEVMWLLYRFWLDSDIQVERGLRPVLIDTVDKVGRRRSSRNERIEINVSVNHSCRDGSLRESILRPSDPKIVYQQHRPKADGVDGPRSRHLGAKVWFPSRTTSKRSHPT